MNTWDPSSSVSWAKLLGMVHVPLFGMHEGPRTISESAILLDGPRASFAFLRTNDPDLAQGVRPLSWSWSSHVRHAVAVIPDSSLMYLRQWDQPKVIRQFRLPEHGDGAVSLLKELEASSEPKRPDVIRYVLEPFRQIRSRINAEEPLWAVRLLNGLLLVAEKLRKNPAMKQDVESVRTFKDAFGMLTAEVQRGCGIDALPKKMAQVQARDFLRHLVAPDPYTGCELLPRLLFRHAASKLYQEAHLEIERNPQGYLPGFEPVEEPISEASPRDVRFTPANLARALTQRALDALPTVPNHLTVLDPACGSGIFLMEVLRELKSRDMLRGRSVNVVGYDISEISEYTSRFCLQYTKSDLVRRGKGRITTKVARCDSLDLDKDWVYANIILMNPPFIPWERLTPLQKEQVSNELGTVARQRPDIAMAFVSKAVKSLKPGGVLACVLPASLLTSQSGIAWREQLSDLGELNLIGRFEGYRYFPTSLVETAFLVYRKKPSAEQRPSPVEVLISEEGSEDAALRALRLDPSDAKASEGIERFARPAKAFTSGNWRPLRQADYEKRDRLTALGLPRVADLFKIRQGVRLGNRVFLLRDQQYSELRKKEKLFFRPAAGGGSIRNGQLRKSEYVFYPYAMDGSSLIQDEEELKSKMPTYYDKYLNLVKDELASRKGFEDRWWELYRKRPWQVTPLPRLISTYFGESGSFAFDDMGEYVTVNGHAWFWTKETVEVSGKENVPFEETPAAWAYLALLNSKIFEDILSLFSVRLQGGQMRLEKRFLADVPLPNLCDESQLPLAVFDQLVGFGKAIHSGEFKAILSDLNNTVEVLYGLTSI